MSAATDVFNIIMDAGLPQIPDIVFATFLMLAIYAVAWVACTRS